MSNPKTDNNPDMENTIPAAEALRSKLKELPRKKVLPIADAAGVPRSTVEKFRLGWIKELGSIKFERLKNAVDAAEAAKTDAQAAEQGA